MAKMTRRQIKEDKLISTTAKLSAFASKYWRQIIGVVAAIVILIAAVLIYYAYITNRNENASQELLDAMILFAGAESTFNEEGKSESTTKEYGDAKTKFQEVVKGGGRDQTICEALFYSAKCSYRLGLYGDAVTSFEKIARKYPKNILAFSAQLGIGQCYEQMGDDASLRKAIQQYDRLSRYPESYLTLKTFIDKGRCYERLGEWDQAIKEYVNIIDKFNAGVEIAVQARCKELVQQAKEIIAKCKEAPGGSQLSADFAKFESEAKTHEANQKWFEALKLYDKAIASQKEAWNEETLSGEGGEKALVALRTYETSSSNLIRYLGDGRRYEKQGNRDEALRNYRRAVFFKFLPGIELYEEAKLRVDWINSVEKSRMAAS